MPTTATAVVEPVDPIFVGLINPQSFIETAAKLRGLTLKDREVSLGAFELSDKMIEEARGAGMSWADGDGIDGRDLRVLSGHDRHFADGRWHLTWPRDGSPLGVLPYARLYHEGKNDGVYAMPFVRRSGGAWHEQAGFHHSSELFIILARHHPEGCPELLKRMAGSHLTLIARNNELGYGPIKQVRTLFLEFAAGREMLLNLWCSPISPFRPEVWELYAPEALWPALLDWWGQQLKAFKKAL